MIIRTEHKSTYDSKGNSLKVCNVVFDGQALKEGKFKKIDIELLAHIMSYMNEDGECTPSMELLAKQMGVTTKTVCNRVAKLLEAQIDVEPILVRELFETGKGARQYSSYTLKRGGEVDEQLQEKKSNAKDVITYFLKKYEEKYEKKCPINWGQATTMTKNKLLAVYDSEMCYKIIDHVVENFDREYSSNGRFQLHIGTLTMDWLLVKVVAIIEEEEAVKIKQEEQFDFDADAYNDRMGDLI